MAVELTRLALVRPHQAKLSPEQHAQQARVYLHCFVTAVFVGGYLRWLWKRASNVD